MGMFKSALRTRALADGSVAAVLGDIQTALMPLKQPNMYVTVACVRGGGGSHVECAVAGHHPVLRVRAGLVDEVTTPQLAVGMFEDAVFTSTRVECRRGDVLALLTDGLIEVFDARNRSWDSSGPRLSWLRWPIGHFRKSPITCWPAHGITARSSTTRAFC